MQQQTLQLDEFKLRQRATWESGDYPALSDRIAEVGELVAARAAIEPGTSLLDVACGTGNAARPAARAGAQVTGVDLARTLLEAGRRKAAEDGLEILWVEGDAERLPFADGSFDRVVSTFGHMFAPRHRQVAGEMIRVCRGGGGRIVTATWTPEGVFGGMSAAAARFMPPPPDFASPPSLWGTEEHVRELFGPAATGFEFERHVNWQEADSLESFADVFMESFPMMVSARAMLGERFGELREAIVEVWHEANAADDGSFRLPQEYLLSVVRL